MLMKGCQNVKMEASGMSPRQKGLLELHLAALFFSFSALFPKILALPVIAIVVGRVIIAATVLYALVRGGGLSLRIHSRKHYGVFALLGILFSVNIFSFYQAIRVSTVAVGVLSTGMFPIIVAILEPWYFKERFRARDLILAFIALGGIILIMPSFDFHHKIVRGIFWGVLAALTFSNYSIINRKMVQEYSSMVVVLYSDCLAGIIFLPALFTTRFTIGWHDIALLLVLGVALTAGSHTLFVKGMTHVKAGTAGMILMLEPIYGILFAFLFIREIPASRTLMGGAIVIATTLYATLSSAHQEIMPVPE